MVFKINLGTKSGKTYKIETESEELVGKSLGEKIQGEVVSPEFKGYEFEIKGATDDAGFIAHPDVEGFSLNRKLFSRGFGMHKRPKGIKKKNKRPTGGLRLRKTVRGKVISPSIIQINMKVVKEGSKPLSEIIKTETPSQ